MTARATVSIGADIPTSENSDTEEARLRHALAIAQEALAYLRRVGYAYPHELHEAAADVRRAEEALAWFQHDGGE